MYETCPVKSSLFLNAFQEVINVMAVEFNLIGQDIVTRIIQLYSKTAEKYIKDRKELDPLSSKYAERERFAKLCVVVIQECYSIDFPVERSKAIHLLEFIYRFGTVGDRYAFAFQGLFNSLNYSSFTIFFKFMTEHFDLNRQALPVINIKASVECRDIKIGFFGFIKTIYDKINDLDPIGDAELFNRHGSMLICSIISCNFVEEFLDFIDFLVNIIGKIDLIQLINSGSFITLAIKVSHVNKYRESFVLDHICGLLISEKIISTLSTNLINFGSLLAAVRNNQMGYYFKYSELLSESSYRKLKDIEIKFNIYNSRLSNVNVLNLLDNDFANFDREDFAVVLEKLYNLIEIFPEYLLNEPSESSETVSRIIKLIPILVSIATEDSKNTFDIVRFEVFILLVKLSLLNDYALNDTDDSFSCVLHFFNSRLRHTTGIDARFHELIQESLGNLIKGSRFFSTIVHHQILYNYFLNVSPQTAEMRICQCFLDFMRFDGSKINSFIIVVSSVKILRLDASVLYSTLLAHEFEEYLKDFSKIPLETYLEGSLVLVSNNILGMNILPKTTQLLVRNLLKLY